MLKLSLRQGQYINIGDNIRVVYIGGSGRNGHFLIDAPKEVPIVRNNIGGKSEPDKENYYPDKKISESAQKKINQILWKENHK